MAKAAKKPAAPRGRPSSYRPEFVEQAKKLCALGATDLELADFFDVNVLTIYRWKNRYPDFCNALTVAKAEADERVERSLYNRAVGYTYDGEKIITVAQGGGVSEVRRVAIKEHVPPDVTAQIFWLKNRRKDTWRDRVDNTHSGPEGGPIETVALTPLEAAQRAAFLLAKGVKAKRGA